MYDCTSLLYHRRMRTNVTFLIYRKAFCRVLPMVFARSGVTNEGFPAYWFHLPDNVFDSPDRNPENACYCRPNVAPCLLSGLADLTPCYYSKLTCSSVMTNCVSSRSVVSLLLPQCTCCLIWRTKFTADGVSWLLQPNDVSLLWNLKDFPRNNVTDLWRELLTARMESWLSAVLSGEISLGFVRIQFLLLWKDSDKPIVPSADMENYLSAQIHNSHPTFCQRRWTV